MRYGIHMHFIQVKVLKNFLKIQHKKGNEKEKT